MMSSGAWIRGPGRARTISVSYTHLAAEAAGITQDAPGEAVLDELTANAYTEWEGKQLYLGDHVEILFPAWYQNGRVVEQGNCRSLETEEG